jgi:hypothetical protein
MFTISEMRRYGISVRPGSELANEKANNKRAEAVDAAGLYMTHLARKRRAKAKARTAYARAA